MSATRTCNPPGPVIAAVSLFGLATVVLSINAVGYVLLIGAPGLLFGVIPLLTAGVALSLWQGRRGARVVAVLLCSVGVAVSLNIFAVGEVLGVVFIAIAAVAAWAVLVPQASRDWFHRG
jgi:hypothetical protein